VTDLTPAGTYIVGAPARPGFMGALANLALYEMSDPQFGDEPYR
jgi:hypothetical protein